MEYDSLGSVNPQVRCRGHTNLLVHHHIDLPIRTMAPHLARSKRIEIEVLIHSSYSNGYIAPPQRSQDWARAAVLKGRPGVDCLRACFASMELIWTKIPPCCKQKTCLSVGALVLLVNATDQMCKSMKPIQLLSLSTGFERDTSFVMNRPRCGG